MINDIDFTHRKHKKYTLISLEDTYCWVQNLETGNTNRCFLVPHEVGDEFYLFEKSTNLYNGNTTFEYSILNLYKEHETYTFDVVKEAESYFLVSSFPHLTFAAPKSFRKNPESQKEELFVKHFDLEKNKLFFGQPNSEFSSGNEYIDNDLSAFEEGKIYTLPIINHYINKNGNHFLVVEYEGNPYYISVPERFAHLDYGNTIECQLGYYTEGNRFSLKLTRHAIISRVYKKGEKYSFFVESQKIQPLQNSIYWVLKDEYGYTNHYYPNSDLSKNDESSTLKEGETVELFVWKITEKGYLALSQNLSVIQPSKYIVEDVFEKIGYQGKEKELFYNLLEETEFQHNDEETDNIKTTYLTQYQQGENLWFFTYFSFLDEKISKKIKEQQYDSAKVLLDVYLKLERWLIYSSDYLKNFLPFKASIIIEKAEFKIETLEALSQAIELMSHRESTSFLEEIHLQMTNTRYLQKDKKNIFKELLKYSNIFENEHNKKSFYECIALLIKNNLLNDNDRFFISKSLEINITQYRENICKEDENLKKDQHYLETVIPYQYLLIILSIHGEENLLHNTYNSVNLLTHLGAYHGNPDFIRLAIHLITKQGIMETKAFLKEDAFQLSIEDFESIVNYPENLNTYYSGKGQVLRDPQALTLIPQNHLIKNIDFTSNTVCKLNDIDIQINSFYSENNLNNYTDQDELLKQILSFLNFIKVKVDQSYNELEGKTFQGKVKTIDHDSYCFLSTKLNELHIEPLLHINSFNKNRFFEDIREYIKPTDIINYKILKINGNKIHINCSDALEKYAEKILTHPITTKGIAISQQEEKNTLVITKEGLPVILHGQYPEGKVLELEIFVYDKDETAFIADNAFVIDENFEENPIELYRKYLSEAGVLILNAENNTETIYTVYQQFDENFRKTSILLLNCLDEYKKYTHNEKESILILFVQTILAGIMKNARSYQYYETLENLYRKSTTNQNKDIPLYGMAHHAYCIIEHFNTKEEISKEHAEKYPKLIALQKIVDAYILCKQYSQKEETKKLFKSIIAEELATLHLDKNLVFIQKVNEILNIDALQGKQKEEKPFNIGIESKTREFKSSLFHSASGETQEKVILRTICGFLNGNEPASLYIGVNDEGDVIGLEKDLQYSPKIQKIDQYQNHLQSLIVGAFPREINHLLDFEFHTAGKLEYLEIKIPKYDKPVSYNNEFYQRQGVQTRILKGADLTDFMYRKVHKIPPTSIPKQEPINYKISSNTADTYLYIYSDNSYMLSTEIYNNALFTLQIPEQIENHYLLICYDNGYVNKVDLSLISDKSKNKKYKNIFSDHATPSEVFIAHDSEEIIFTTHKQGVSYVKILPIQQITTNKLPTLKGKCLVQDDFDELIRVDIRSNLSSEFDVFRQNSKQNLGSEVAQNESLYLKIISHKR